MSTPIATSAYRLADSQVLIAVGSTPAGPAPLFTEVSGEVTCVAYTDRAEAEADRPATHELFAIVVSDLLAQLPAEVGLVIDPRAASPIYLPADGKQQVAAAGAPFPVGAETAIGEPAQEPTALLDAVRADADAAPGLRRVWRTWYQVADAYEKLLVVYELDRTGDGPGPIDDQVSALVLQAAATAGYEQRVLVLPLEAVPDQPRRWLLENTPPFYERA